MLSHMASPPALANWFSFPPCCLPSNVPVSKQELPAEITLLNDVIISYGHQALVTTCHAHHGKVLEELTAQGTSSHQEQLQGLQLLLDAAAKHSHLGVIPGRGK